MRLLRAATVAVIAALALTGCNGESYDPADSMSTWTPSGTVDSPNPSATESATDGLTVAPKGETARQFIRRWVALSYHMKQTGDTAAFLAVAGPDCDSCHKLADQIEKIRDGGGYIRGGEERVINMVRESPTQWVITRTGEPTEYTESSSGPVKSYPGGEYRSRLYLAKVDGVWIVGATEGLRS